MTNRHAKNSSGIIRHLFGKPEAFAGRSIIFLDRDGIINKKIEGGYVTAWDSFHFLPGIGETLRALSGLGSPIVIVSNQACVGKGLLTSEGLGEITHRFVDQLQRDGARIDAVYYCPHRVEDRCDCRKPRPGLLQEAAHDWAADMRQSVFVGDSPTDLDAAAAAGCNAVIVSEDAAIRRVQNIAVIQIRSTTGIYDAVSKLCTFADSRYPEWQPFSKGP